jgi:predicted metal-dependent TIM-barrel fold hydrolase
VVLSSGNPHVFQEVHDEVPDLDDMIRYWEGAIKFAPMAGQKYLMNVFVALGVSFMTRWQQWEEGLELLPKYLKMPGVVALGETGVDPWQYWGYKAPMDEQKAIVTEEVRIAKELDIPIILHTPTQRKGFMPEMKPEEYKRHFLDIDMEIINREQLQTTHNRPCRQCDTGLCITRDSGLYRNWRRSNTSLYGLSIFCRCHSAPRARQIHYQH